MKQIKLKLFLLISLNVFLATGSANAESAQKILFGSSAYALPANVQEFVYSGFVLALKHQLTDQEIKEILYQDQRPGKSAIEAAEIIQENLAKQPLAVFGFPSTHESQLVAPILKNTQTLTIFASTTNSNIKGLGQNIFSTSDDPRKTILSFVDIIKTKFRKKHGIILYFPEDYFSLDQKTLWTVATQENPEINVTFRAIKGQLIEKALLDEVAKSDYAVVTSFPNRAFDLLAALNNSKIDIPIFTNTSWYKVNFEILSRVLAQKSSEVYMMDAWDQSSRESQSFSKEYSAAYHSHPNIEAAIGYELGSILGDLLTRSKASGNKNLLSVLQSNPCFKSGPLGSICFEPTGGFAHRKLSLIKVIKGKKRVIRTVNS